MLYYAAGRERVPVLFDEKLRRATHKAITGLRRMAAGGRIPPPLEDSPKCPRCSLVGICLPDEVNFFRGSELTPRPLAVGQNSALPLYVQTHHAKISKSGERLDIYVDDDKTQSVRLIDVS